MLYVFDPTALHTIVVKDQYVFEQAAFVIKCVAITCPGSTLLDYHCGLSTHIRRFNWLRFGPGLPATLGKCTGPKQAFAVAKRCCLLIRR